MTKLNETHDPSLQSWVETANDAASDFPIQNLPFGVFRRRDSGEAFRGGVAIGDQIVDLEAACAAQIFSGAARASAEAARSEALNALMGMGPAAAASLRLALSRALRRGAQEQAALSASLVAQDQAEYALPARIGDYTDFYVGVHHATAIGKMFRPDQPLTPNYKWVPIGYHGRASSVVVSGAPVVRPQGQTKGEGATPEFGPSKRLDYELELAFFIGAGNARGAPIAIGAAEDHLFGVGLFNDWSARDIQAWEYQPLGPFLAKNFASTVSPWIVTMEALAPFRAPFERPDGDPQPLAYLDSAANRASGALDIDLEILIQTQAMRASGAAPVVIARSNARQAAYWTPAQLVAHHTVGGCNLQPGDLFGSGTLSGAERAQAGSLLELAEGGKAPVALPGGETRSFLADGDTIIFRGWCQRAGARRIGFGACAGTIVAAR
ncbi:MAG: fumarylacetoacetase [Hyphomicrobiales bacterium]|nr:fumarylacetoacetase [Hyphomicrobiales bacterium]